MKIKKALRGQNKHSRNEEIHKIPKKDFWEITFSFVMIINGCCFVAVVWCYLPLTVTLIVLEIPVRTPF